MGPNKLILEQKGHFSKVLYLIANIFAFVILSFTFGYLFNNPKQEQFYLEIYSKLDLLTIYNQLFHNFRIAGQPTNGFRCERLQIKFYILQKGVFSQKVKFSTFSWYFNSLFF